MRYAQINSKYVCGIDLHARNMYACVMNEKGEILFHRNMRTDFDQFKKKMAPFLSDMTVGVESTYMYYWLADACRERNIPFFLGHAYYMKTIHGGKTKTDRLDCRKIADLMRTNYYPLAYDYPKEMRAKAKCHDRASLNILLSVPGIGDIFSLIILYEICDINRFQSHQKFCSYARLVKCERSSAGKYAKGGNQKIGNPYLKWAIADIIIHAATKSKPIGDFYQKLQSRLGKRKAKSVISHKFGIAIYYMLKNKQVFDEKRFVQTNMK
jgi:transposase